jgi:hypothetical protein
MFPLRKPANVIADRLTRLFAAHDIRANQIPRLLPSIQYEDLESPKTLLPAITPAVIDATAQLFGMRGAWLEGLDDTIYDVHWARRTPERLLSRLGDAIAAKGRERNRFPLRVLTTSMNLDREGQHQQWLVPVIVETVDELGDTLVYRCHVFGNVYDWTLEAARLELKAVTWLVWDQLRTPVPLYQVTPKELEQVSMGQAIPSVLWRRGPISEPSLEDFVLPPEKSRQAKEIDELAKLRAYLDAGRLRECRLEAPSLLNRTATPEADATRVTEDAAPASPEKSTQRAPTAPGKRQTHQASWDAIVTAAQTIWAKPPYLSYADMIQRLKSMPHLKATALSSSAIHKHLRAIAPPEVRGKPGRKPKQSA